MQLHHLKAGEICFEKSEVLSSFINDVSKSRNRDFCLRKSVEGAGGVAGWGISCFLSRGTFERGGVDIIEVTMQLVNITEYIVVV